MAVDRTQAMGVIKELLKHGTPDWVRFPQHYKAMVHEWHRKAQEDLHEECRDYKVDDQDELADPRGRRVNIMAAAVFMRKLREAGLTCFSHDSPLMDHSASLFALPPGRERLGFIPVASIQVPWMYEWSLLRIDPATNLPTGFRDIGWRSAVRCLITNGIFTEARAHEIFGEPRVFKSSRRYRRMLYDYRNARRQNAA
jgi:hypothetical protein